MGLIFIFVLIIVFIGYLSFSWTDSGIREKKIGNMIAGMIVSGAILTFVTIIALSMSYSSYITLKEKLAVIEQYKEAIELYADKGVQEFKPGSLSGPSEFTDLKYNNYQTQIGQMIREMRDTIVYYNTALTGKQIMKDGFMFSWLIYLPEDMKAIKMADYIK